MEATFCASSLGRTFPDADTPDLEQLLQSPYEDMDMDMLGSALFEQGLLNVRRRRVKHTCDNLGLGDIGYMTEHNNFAVIGNMFNLILSTLYVSDIWRVVCHLSHFGEDFSLEKLEGTETLGYSGQSYWRQRHIDYSLLGSSIDFL